MITRRQLMQCIPILILFSLLIAAGSAFGLEADTPDSAAEGESLGALPYLEMGLAGPLSEHWLIETDDSWKTVDTDNPYLLAQTGGPPPDQMEEMSPECAEFAKDPMADVGDVMRAGCQPTMAQMSRVMDNPLGNVAMWFN